MIALTLAATLAVAPARPPDGTYTYAITRAGAKIGTSVLAFKTSGSMLTVQERADLGALQATTNTVLDGNTLQETAYNGTSPQQGSFSVTFENGGVTIHSGSTAVPLQAVGGQPIVVADGLVSSAALIPAIMHASSTAKSFTLAALNGGKAFAASSGSTTARPPQGVPQTDAAMTLTYAGATATLWYDPKTNVLDLLQNPTASVDIRLVSRSAQAAIAPIVVATPVPLPAAKYVTRTVTFPAAFGAQLAGALTIPEHAHLPLPAIVMVPGSGAQDRDEAIGPNKIFLQLANALSNHGYIVLRYDKRGVGASRGEGINDFRQYAVADADGAFHYAQTLPEVDKKRIYLLGHSEGGMSVPIIASREKGIRGIILLAPAAVPLAQVVSKQEGAKALSSLAQFREFLQSWAGYVPAQTIAQVPCPILVVQGGKDMQVLASDLPHLVDAARTAHRNITVRLLPDDDHIFLKLPGAQRSTGTEYYRPAYIDPALAAAILSWLAG